MLREVSQHADVKLRSLAELVLRWGRRGELPADIRAELEDVLDRRGPTQVPGAPPPGWTRPSRPAGPEQPGPPSRRVSRRSRG